MKITSFAVLIFASCIVAKNVVYLENLAQAMQSDQEKREPKNVVNLEDLLENLKDGNSDFSLTKRKNVVELQNWLHKRSLPQRPVQPVPLLQSILPQVLQVSIFARYVRDDADVLLELGNSESFTLFVAPSDQAVASFLTEVGLKPWEFPEPVKDDATDDAVIGRNIDAFVKAHMSQGNPIIDEHNTLSGVLLNGEPFKITKREVEETYTLEINGKKVPISSVHLAGNGIVFVVEKVLVLGKMD